MAPTVRRGALMLQVTRTLSLAYGHPEALSLRRLAIRWPRRRAFLDLDLEGTEQLREHRPVPDCDDHFHEHGRFLELPRAFRPHGIRNLSLLASIVGGREYRPLGGAEEIRFLPIANRDDF